MFCLFSNVRNDRQYLATTGLNKAEFDQLLVHFQQTLDRSPEHRPGPEGCLTSVASELFFGLFYLKTYPSFYVLGVSFGIEAPSAQKHLRRILAQLNDTLRREHMLPARRIEHIDQLDELLKTLETTASDDQIWIDATEREASRPQDQDAQKARYSGGRPAARSAITPTKTCC